MDKFKVGDKVKLVSMKNEDSFYKKYLGKIFTIKQVGCIAVTFKEATEEHISPYLYNLQKVEEKYTYEDLKKAPIGTKITFESGIILIKVDKENYKEIKEYGTTRYIELLKGLKDNWQFMNQGKIIKIEEPTYKAVYKVKPKILDETEKRYLSSVIRPFRDKIKYIIKVKSSYDNNFYIRIVLNNDVSTLPYFKKNTMYKGMKIDKEYTLKELGL